MRFILALLFIFTTSTSFSQPKSDTTKAKFTAYVFLGENCPICQFHTLTLNNLYKDYSAKGIEIIGYFPNPESDLKSIETFKKEYLIQFQLKKDVGRTMMKKLDATITPQVFLVAKDSVYYKGRINDAFETLGVKKSKIQSPDLENAIIAVLNSKPVAIKETEAVGCFIDSDY